MPVTETVLRDQIERAPCVVRVIDDAVRFTALGDEWTDLLRNSASNNPFLTWEWLHAWWMHLAGSRALHLVTVRTGDGRLIGIAPLSASRGRLPWLSQLEFLGTGWAGSDYLDVIARRGFERECAEAVTNWLRSRGQTVRFDHLPPRSLAAAVGARLDEGEWGRASAPSGVCPFATLQGHSWQSYLATVRPSHRTRCRRYVNTLRKKFDVHFERVDSEPRRIEALSSLMGFHEQRWRTRGGSTAFQTPELRAFHHTVTRRALDSGWLRLQALRLDGDIAAVTYCFFVGGRFYLYQHGFNPRYRQFSVGVVVLGLTIRSALEEGAAEFDMLYGDEPYKTLWANETRALERLELFPPHIRGRFHRRTVDAERTLRLFARRLFPRKPCDSNVHRAGAAC